MTKAQEAIALHRETGLPVIWCRDAVRAHTVHEDRLLALRLRLTEWQRDEHPGESYGLPPALRTIES
jgi:hypothetical protein